MSGPSVRRLTWWVGEGFLDFWTQILGIVKCVSDVLRCVKERTFPLSSTIKQPVMNFSLWSSYMATAYYGMCHTFRSSEKMGAAFYGGQFFLDPNISYKVIIHDPQFYHILPVSLVFPRIWLDFKTTKLEKILTGGPRENHFWANFDFCRLSIIFTIEIETNVFVSPPEHVWCVHSDFLKITISSLLQWMT